jgi:hypothetical protein
MKKCYVRYIYVHRDYNEKGNNNKKGHYGIVRETHVLKTKV